MKTKILTMLAAFALLPITGFTQPAPVAPVAPVPPVPPIPNYKDKDKDKDKDRPKVPITWLGVETSSIPRVVSEQLGLQRGFGLVVDYVVPDGPAAAAGVQTNDILKMFNDQILMDPDQLSKLVRSNAEGTTVTLTVLRKNAEQKISVKLGKKEIRQRDHDFGFNMNMEDFNEKMQAFNDKMKDFKFDFNNMNFDPNIRETVREAQREAARATREAAQKAREQARDAAQQARDQAQRARDEAQRIRDEAQRNRDNARSSSRDMRIITSDNGAMKSTTIDLGKATIVFTDDKGEMKLETVGGKKILTAKDPQGKLLFSGPVDTQDDINKIPANVRERYDKLEHKDLPTINPSTFVENEDMENDNDKDNDEDNDRDEDSDGPTVNPSDSAQFESISCPRAPRFARNINFLSV